MRALLFILFIIVAAMDSSSLTGAVCLEAFVILCLLDKKERGGSKDEEI